MRSRDPKSLWSELGSRLAFVLAVWCVLSGRVAPVRNPENLNSNTNNTAGHNNKNNDASRCCSRISDSRDDLETVQMRREAGFLGRRVRSRMVLSAVGLSPESGETFSLSLSSLLQQKLQCYDCSLVCTHIRAYYLFMFCLGRTRPIHNAPLVIVILRSSSNHPSSYSHHH